MAKKRKSDKLSLVGLASAISRNIAQQRSLAKARERRAARLLPKQPKPPKPKKPKDTRTAEEIRATVDATRTRLVATVDSLKYHLDVPARLRDVRNRAARRLPREVRGEPKATIAGVTVLVTGLGSIALATVARFRRHR